MATSSAVWLQGIPCWVDAQVDDIAQASHFYSALFGWDVQAGPPEAGGYAMATLGGQAAAGIGPKPMPMPSVWTTYLAADSADVTADKIVAAGGTLIMPPFDVMDVGRMFVATDPTGAVFGVWQAKAHTGAGIFNEPGAYCWNELHTRDVEAAKKFYREVFGWTYSEMGSGEGPAYTLFATPGREDPVGGINDLNSMPGDAPAHWLTWFQVANVEDSVSKVSSLGGSTAMAPFDSPAGRMAVVAGANGEIFGLITPPSSD